MLVDSSVWIDYFIGRDTAQTRTLDENLGRTEIATGDLILLEVLQGFRSDRDYRTAKKLFAALFCFELLGTDMAVRCAENFRALRKKGVTVRKTADVIIASFCIDHHLPLLFSDKDFKPFVKHLGLIEV